MLGYKCIAGFVFRLYIFPWTYIYMYKICTVQYNLCSFALAMLRQFNYIYIFLKETYRGLKRQNKIWGKLCD